MRKNYLDNIRWATIILVVLFHVFFYFNNIGVDAIFEDLPAYNDNSAMTFPGIYQYVVYPWFMTLLFVVAGISAYHALQKKTSKEFMKERCFKLFVPSTLGVIAFGWMTGGILSIVCAGDALKDTPLFVRYLIATMSGTGALWFIQVLFIVSWILTLVRKVVLKFHKEELFVITSEKTAYIVLVLMFFAIWGTSNILNPPLIESYRFGIYTTAFLLGYYVFSQDIIIEILEKWKFVNVIATLLCGAAFVISSYGTYYGHASLLGSFKANIYTFFMILAIFGIFKAFFDKRNNISAFLSRISFDVYVLHIPLFVITLYLLSFTNLSVVVKYLILLPVGYVLTPFLGLVIEKIPVIRFLVLGINKKKI